MKEMLIEGSLNKQRGSIWIGRSGDSSTMASPICGISVGSKAIETIPLYI